MEDNTEENNAVSTEKPSIFAITTVMIIIVIVFLWALGTVIYTHERHKETLSMIREVENHSHVNEVLIRNEITPAIKELRFAKNEIMSLQAKVKILEEHIKRIEQP